MQHPIQRKIVELSQVHDLSSLSLRKIGRLVGENHPQKVKHHMQQLGLLAPSPATKAGAEQSRLYSIPLLGLANCGPATIYTDSHEGLLLQVSQRLLPRRSEHMFAVQAVGDSMNCADINGNNIESGDYIIVNPEEKDFRNDDYVLSIINGMANVKRFTKDSANKQIVLSSESSEEQPPIYIHEDDMAYFMTSGKVVAVLKRPKRNLSDDITVVKTNQY